jgi:hypothetical protein
MRPNLVLRPTLASTAGSVGCARALTASEHCQCLQPVCRRLGFGGRKLTFIKSPGWGISKLKCSIENAAKWMKSLGEFSESSPFKPDED